MDIYDQAAESIPDDIYSQAANLVPDPHKENKVLTPRVGAGINVIENQGRTFTPDPVQTTSALRRWGREDVVESPKSQPESVNLEKRGVLYPDKPEEGIWKSTTPGGEVTSEAIRSTIRPVANIADLPIQVKNLLTEKQTPTVTERLFSQPELEEQPAIQRTAQDWLIGAPIQSLIGAGVGKALKLGKVSKVPSAIAESPKPLPEVNPNIQVPPLETIAEVAPREAKSLQFINRMQGPDDFKNMVQNMVESNPEYMAQAKQGAQSIEAIKSKARSLGWDVSDVEARKIGTAWNAPESMAAMDVAHSSLTEAKVAVDAAVQAGTDAAKGEAKVALSRAFSALAQARGGVSEAARTLRVAQEAVTGEISALNKIRKVAGSPEHWTDDILEKFSQMDPTNPQQLREFLLEAGNKGWTEKAKELWINGLLSGPQTHLRNSISNTAVALSRPVERAIGAGMEAVTGQGTAGLRALPGDVKGAMIGFVEGLKNGWKAFKTEIPQFGGTKLEVAGDIPSIKGNLGRVVRMPGRALMAADEVFKTVGYTSELYSQAYRQAIKEGAENLHTRVAELIRLPTEEMKKAATREALDVTFQNPLGPVASHLIKMRDQSPVLQVIMPFVRTPINILKYGLKRTPANLGRIAYKAAKGEMAAKEVTDELSKVAFGSGLSAAIMAYVGTDMITGAPPSDPQERDVWYSTGRKPYSIKVGNEWKSYGGVEPLGSVLGLATDFKRYVDVMEMEDSAAAFATAVAKNLASKTFLVGISDALNAMQNPERYGETWTGRIAGSVVPSVVASAARAEDKTIYKPKGAIDAIRSRIPFLDKSDINKVRDIWGKPAVRTGSAGEIFLSPIAASMASNDPATQEVFRLKLQPGTPAKEIMGAKLTDDEYIKYVERAGELSHLLVTSLVSDPSWAKKDDIKKSAALEAAFVAARKHARRETIKGIAGFKERIREEKIQ